MAKNVRIHPSAICEAAFIADGVRIEALACVCSGAKIGLDARIGSLVYVGESVVLGADVVIEPGAHLLRNVRVEDGVRIGAGAVVAARAAGSRAVAAMTADVTIRSGASIGAGAIVHEGLVIGPRARIEPGAVVARSVPANAIVTGSPAQIIGYVAADGADAAIAQAVVTSNSVSANPKPTTVRGVNIHRMTCVEDLRGNLSVGELGRDVPFEVRRYFLVYDVPNMEIRGEHAHRKCHQFLIAVKGKVHVVADDGHNREEVVLDHPGTGLHLPPMIWGIQHQYSSDAVLLVLASDHYDAADYIRDHDEFAALVSDLSVV